MRWLLLRYWIFLAAVAILMACSGPQRPIPRTVEPAPTTAAAEPLDEAGQPDPADSAERPPVQEQQPVQPADAAPAERVELFFQDFVGALNDPNLDDPQQQRAQAEKLARHFEPAGREALIADFEQQFQSVGDTIEWRRLVESQAQVTMAFELSDFVIEPVEQTDSYALLRIKQVMISIAISGEAMTQVPPEVARPAPVDLMPALGGSGDTIEVRRIDGEWYLVADE